MLLIRQKLKLFQKNILWLLIFFNIHNHLVLFFLLMDQLNLHQLNMDI